MLNNNIVVSVWITTYNHEKYIAKALDSVLMQEVDFDYEIIIGEDLSTDNTRDILMNYKDKYPDKIKLFFRDKNIGQTKNGLLTWQSCRGKYVAMLDGDDFWQDPFKLQKQVDFLEDNPAYTISYHDSNLIDENDIVFSDTAHYRKDYSQDELICSIATMPTSATMLRNMQIDFPDYMKNTYSPDTVIVHYAGFEGKAKFQDNIKNSVYRIHSTSTWSTRLNQVQKALHSIEARRIFKLNIEDDVRLKSKIEESIEQSYLEYLFAILRSNDFKSYGELIGIVWNDKETKRGQILAMHAWDIPKRIVYKIIKSIGIKK